jgi:hypothetical protein
MAGGSRKADADDGGALSFLSSVPLNGTALLSSRPIALAFASFFMPLSVKNEATDESQSTSVLPPVEVLLNNNADVHIWDRDECHMLRLRSANIYVQGSL